MIKRLGIGFLYLLPFGYMWYMSATDQPIEWFVVIFIFAMAVLMTLFATVLKKHLENTPENRETLVKIIKKVALRGFIDKD